MASSPGYDRYSLAARASGFAAPYVPRTDFGQLNGSRSTKYPSDCSSGAAD